MLAARHPRLRCSPPHFPAWSPRCSPPLEGTRPQEARPCPRPTPPAPVAPRATAAVHPPLRPASAMLATSAAPWSSAPRFHGHRGRAPLPPCVDGKAVRAGGAAPGSKQEHGVVHVPRGLDRLHPLLLLDPRPVFGCAPSMAWTLVNLGHFAVCTAKMNLSDEVDLEDYVCRPGYFCPALAKAVKTMKKAEKVLLIVKPQYGFGEKGSPAVGEEGVVMSIILFYFIANELVELLGVS